MKLFEVSGGVGGLILLFTAIVVIGRGIFRQVSVTEDNTGALNDLSEKIDKLTSGYNEHDVRLAVLEDRIRR
jgi:hypothetical protein